MSFPYAAPSTMPLRLLAVGIVRNNCMNNTARVGNQLRLHRVDRQLPLLLSINEADINNDLIRQAMQNLEAHRCTVHCIERKSCALAHHC